MKMLRITSQAAALQLGIAGSVAHAQPLTASPIASGPANPLSYAGRTNPPFLLFHGDQDRLVSPSQTLILH